MAFGVSAEVIYAVAAAAGTAVSVYGSVEAGNEKKAAAEFNAREAENKAAYDQDAAAAQAGKIRKAARSTASSADAQLAANGVKIGEGSAQEISRTIYQESEEDAYNAILTGKRGADSATRQAGLLRAAGGNAMTDGYIGAGSTILGSAAGVAKGWKTSGTTSSSTGYGYGGQGQVNGAGY